MIDQATLLLVDTQEDFLARPGLTPDRATLVANLAALLGHARNSGWRVIHVHTRVAADLSDAMPHRRGGAEAVAGTPGFAAPPELAPRDCEPLLFKRFFSAFDAAGLEPLLRSAPTGTVVVGGVHSHACIRDTINDAYRLGFEVVVPDDATASYDPAHAGMALDWLNGRSARVMPLVEVVGQGAAEAHWVLRDPCDQRREIERVRLTPAAEVREHAAMLASRQAGLEELGVEARRNLLADWSKRLRQSRSAFRDALVEDIAKPVRDAEGEIDYGLALLDAVAATLADEEEGSAPRVRYRPRGLVGLITPWNNPFAIAVGKIAPALGHGNAVLWKPALAASRVSALLSDSLADSGLGEWLSLVPGDSGTGDAIVRDPEVAALSFTGSVPVGRQLIARAGARAAPPAVQAELGGSNAAIIDPSADLDAAAADLAGAMFSFSGQRCTAVRRVILVDEIADAFTERLVAAVGALRIDLPADGNCDLGPLIDRASRARILNAIDLALAAGGRVLCGGSIPRNLPNEGCWLQPTLIDGLGPDHPLNSEEWFGPIGSILRAADFDEALRLHNHSRFGLLGALYATDEERIARFTAEAEAGILSIGRARPAFAASGPFAGWKASGFGIAEHGRWNREFYTRVQALYPR